MGEIPQDRKRETLAKFFVEIARKDSDVASNIIAVFIKEDKKRIDSREISPQTFPNHIKPIKVLLDSNRVAIHWKSLTKLFPRIKRGSNDRACTREEVQRMLEITNDITDNVIVLLFSSRGFRLEAGDSHMERCGFSETVMAVSKEQHCLFTEMILSNTGHLLHLKIVTLDVYR